MSSPVNVLFIRRGAILAAALLSWATIAHSQTVTWTGMGSDDYTDTVGNWQGSGLVLGLPINDGTEHFIFGPSIRQTVSFGTPIQANKVSILGITSPYLLDDDNNELILGPGGLVYAPAAPVNSIIGAYFVELAGDQIWDIQNGELGFYYDLTGTGRLTKTGAGTLSMPESFTWTGGLTLNAGQLVLDNNNSTSWTLGDGNLIIGPPPGGLTPPPTLVTRRSNDYSISISNVVEVNGILATHNEVELNLTGGLTLNSDTTIMAKGDWLIINGPIADGPTASPAARKLTIDSGTAVILDSANTYSGGTHVQNGILVFATEGSLPVLPVSNALTSSVSGYIGFGDDGTSNEGVSLSNPQGLFLDRFNKANTFGTIGFDTDPELVTSNNYSGGLNLTGFAASARLGSATHVIVSGLITPQGGTSTDPYRFGGGGGTLTVASQLTGARNVVADSPADLPLTVRLINTTNDFTGTVTADYSALILGDNVSLPAGAYGMNSSGYIGTEDPEVTAATFLPHFTTASQGIIGLDIAPGTLTTREIDNLSMATIGAGVSFGTASALYDGFGEVNGPGLRLTGSIAPNSDSVHRFAGYKGGALEVAGTLTGSAMVIGHPDSLGAFGDRIREEYSTVLLTGNNSGGLAGGVTFYGGRLMLGQGTGTPGTDPSTVLGTALLTVAPVSFMLDDDDEGPEIPAGELAAFAGNLIVPNNIFLQTELNVGGDSNFTLAGTITGSGELYVGQDSVTGFTLTLSGNNSFGGGVYVSRDANVNAGTNTALGIGPLEFGAPGGRVYFQTTGPVIGGLTVNNDNDYGYLYANQPDTTLTINQSFDSKFRGEFRSNAYPGVESMRLVKNGTGTIRFDYGGLFFYNGIAGTGLPGDPQVNLQINQGTVVLGNDFYIEGSAPTIWVNGGTLALDGFNYARYNPLVVNNGGRLAGSGIFASAVNIGTGATLAPGLSGQGGIGFFNIYELNLLGGGAYEWNLQSSADPQTSAHDMIEVSQPATLDFSGIDVIANPIPTAANRFTLKAISLQADGTPGLAGGFLPEQTYSWTIFNYLSLAAFDPSKIIIDPSLFVTNLGTGFGAGTFSVFDNGDNQLMLSFTAVPEPSTYALILLGLAMIMITVRRRRRFAA